MRGHQNKKQSAIHKLLPYKDNRDFIYRIKKCEKTGLLDLEMLNLNNSDVEEILNYVTEKNITVRMLDLSNNQLTTLPESITKLPSLKRLFLSNNQLITLPESIGDLQSLEILGLGINQLTTLPESIGKLQSLKKLFLGNNHFTTLPESITKLQSLEKLYLDHNLLITLPESIGKLQSLKHLDLRFNELTALPESIGDLQSLEDLYLTKNYLNVESIQFQNGITALFQNGITAFFQNGITALFRDQKNENNLKCDFQNAQQAKQIIDDKVCWEGTGDPLGQLTFQDAWNFKVIDSLDQSKDPKIDNESIYSLLILLQAYQRV